MHQPDMNANFVLPLIFSTCGESTVDKLMLTVRYPTLSLLARRDGGNS